MDREGHARRKSQLKTKAPENPENKRNSEQRKKKLCFKQPLYTNKDLNEAYEEMQKKRETEKDKKKRPSVHPVKDKSVRKSGNLGSGSSKEKKRLSVRITYTPRESAKIKKFEFASKSPSKSVRPNSETVNILRSIKKVPAKVDTGLPRHAKSLQRNELNLEKRRVKKDFVFNGLVLPEVRLKVREEPMAVPPAEDMCERLVVQEPKAVDFQKILGKVVEDRLDYLSELDTKDHFSSQSLFLLKKFSFDFGASLDSEFSSKISQTSLGKLGDANHVQNFFVPEPDESNYFSKGKESQESGVQDLVRNVFESTESEGNHQEIPKKIFSIDLDFQPSHFLKMESNEDVGFQAYGDSQRITSKY